MQAAIATHNQAHAAHVRLRSRSSDALSSLHALLAYESVSAAEATNFCKANFLHAAPLREMAALHQQLRRVLSMPSALRTAHASGHAGAVLLAHEFGAAPSDSGTGARAGAAPAPTKQPRDAQAKVLRRCVAAAWPDQVAKRVKSQASLQQHAEAVRLGGTAAWMDLCTHRALAFICQHMDVHACPSTIITC